VINTLVWLLCIFIACAIVQRLAMWVFLAAEWFAVRKQRTLARKLSRSGLFDSNHNN
jgi:hypothetical protein